MSERPRKPRNSLTRLHLLIDSHSKVRRSAEASCVLRRNGSVLINLCTVYEVGRVDGTCFAAHSEMGRF